MCPARGGCDNAAVRSKWTGPDAGGAKAGALSRSRGAMRRVLASSRSAEPFRGPSVRGLVLDFGLAVALALVALVTVYRRSEGAQVEMAVPNAIGYLPTIQPVHTGPSAGTVALVLLATLPLAARRRYPLIVFWIVLEAALEIPDSPRILVLSCLIAAFSAAAHSPYRIPALASLGLAAVLIGLTRNTELPQVSNKLVPFVLLFPVAAAANAIRGWRRKAAATQERIRYLEQRQQEETQRAVELERARIARELHDVVTHNVSVMIVQTGAARKVMAAAPQQAEQALLAVEASGRAAMAELRQVMGLLNDGADGNLAPQPGLERLDALVGRVRDSGTPVTLTVTGRPRPVPPGIGLTAYRVVQEALTNTVKHAAGASAGVTVAYTPDALRLEIADTGGGTDAEPCAVAGTGNGSGLIGLRERLAVYGGSLEMGARPTGGYRVRALIPLAPEDAVPYCDMPLRAAIPNTTPLDTAPTSAREAW